MNTCKLNSLLAAFCLAGVVTGCSTVEMTSAGAMKNGDRLLVIQNDGYELLWTIPLWSGGMTWDAKTKTVDCSPALFRNLADTQHLYEMAQKVAERENCDLVNVTFVDNYLGLNPNNLYGAIKSSEVTASAILRPRKK